MTARERIDSGADRGYHVRMSDLRVKTIDETEIDTVLAEDIDFDGEMTFENNLLVKGSFKGGIRSAGDLFISKGAVVEATVEAATVSVKGRIIGDIHARSRLELFAASRIDGNITTPNLIMQSGSVFNGTCSMTPTEDDGEATGEIS